MNNETKFYLKTASQDDTLGIMLYGPIGQGESGVSAANVIAALGSVKGYKNVTMHINSPGGDLFEGTSIFNALRSLGKPVHVVVDALAASAASLVAMAGDKITMNPGSVMMIHEAQALCMGYSTDMKKMGEVLDTVTSAAADVYVTKTGIAKNKILAYMKAETWMNADDAVAKKFADNVGTEAKVTNSFDLSRFKHTPEELKIPEVVAGVEVVPKITNETSLQSRINDFQEALDEKFPSGTSGWPAGLYWAVEVFSNNAIVAQTNDNDEYFRVSYTVDANDEVTIGDTLQPVERTWVPSASVTARVAEMNAKKVEAFDDTDLRLKRVQIAQRS